MASARRSLTTRQQTRASRGLPTTARTSASKQRPCRPTPKEHDPVPPPSTTNSRPGRLLVALGVLLIVMFAGVLGSNIGNPGHWHKSFKVGLGLDLSWGTQITLKAVPPKGHTVDQGAMSKARAIMLARIDGSGFTGASVVQQSSNYIVVSVPHENAEAVTKLVGT